MTGKGKQPILQLHISLVDIEPLIWRRVLVPYTMALSDLHRMIQEVFGWQDYHLYEFQIAGESYVAPEAEVEGADARRFTLKRLKLEPGSEFEYVYDFGDYWQHVIKVEAREPKLRDGTYPCCNDGERAGPPEDCGGPDGYANLIRSLRDPSDPGHADMVVWAGSWSPELFDLRAVNRILQLAFPTRGRSSTL